MGIKISNCIIADDSNLKTQTVSISGKSIITPRKAIGLKKLHNEIDLDRGVRGIGEIHTSFTEDNLKDYQKGRFDTKKRTISLNTPYNKINEDIDEISLCFVSYRGESFPDENGIKLLTNTAYSYSDITPLTLIPKLGKIFSDPQKRYNKYKEFVKQQIDIINRLNKKDIMGIIPCNLHTAKFSDLIDFYTSNNITSFAFDFNGSSINSLRIILREFFSSVNERIGLDNSFLYAINVPPGKFPSSASIVPAKNFFSLGVGFDVLGENHEIRISKEAIKAIQEKIAKLGKPPKRYKLFSSVDYGYKTSSNLEDFSTQLDIESNINKKHFTDNKSKAEKAEAMYNFESMGKEAKNLKKIIKEKTKDTLGYFKTKSQVTKKEIKLFKDVKEI